MQVYKATQNTLVHNTCSYVTNTKSNGKILVTFFENKQQKLFIYL